MNKKLQNKAFFIKCLEVPTPLRQKINDSSNTGYHNHNRTEDILTKLF